MSGSLNMKVPGYLHLVVDLLTVVSCCFVRIPFSRRCPGIRLASMMLI